MIVLCIACDGTKRRKLTGNLPSGKLLVCFSDKKCDVCNGMGVMVASKDQLKEI